MLRIEIWNPMGDTVTCTLDILIQFPQSLFITHTHLHSKLDLSAPMTTNDESEKFEIIRPMLNGCKPDRLCNKGVS